MTPFFALPGMRRARRDAVTVALAALTLAVGPFGAAAGHAATAAESGGSAGPVSREMELSPGADLQAAVDLAAPGTTITLAPGTYAGPVTIDKPGLVLESSPAGRATITASLPTVPCDASSPAQERTVMLTSDADRTTIKELDIDGGIYVEGDGNASVVRWLTDTLSSGAVVERRSAPGLSSRDRVAATGIIDWYAARFGRPMDPVDGVVITGNSVTERGIFAGLTRFLEVSDNSVSHQACGIGSAIWVNSSYFAHIERNDVTDLAVSTFKHYMQEGIRIGAGSAYDTVSDNTVHDIDGESRGISTDYSASFNTITRNVVSNVYNGLDDEQDGWGNIWSANQVSHARNKGIVLAGLGAFLYDTVNLSYSSVGAVVTDNVVTDTAHGLLIGSVKDCTFRHNTIESVAVAPSTRVWFGAMGNTWNGDTVAP